MLYGVEFMSTSMPVDKSTMEPLRRIPLERARKHQDRRLSRGWTRSTSECADGPQNANKRKIAPSHSSQVRCGYLLGLNSQFGTIGAKDPLRMNASCFKPAAP